MENQQAEVEGRLEQMDDTRFRRRYGTEWVLLDEKEGEVVEHAVHLCATIF